MVIEHSFISSKPPAEVLYLAAQYLAGRGFFDLEDPTGERVRDMSRGVRRAQRAKSIVELPQRVRVEYDRGRVSVAASIEPNAVWGGANSYALAGVTTGRPQKMIVHERLLRAIVVGLESLLAYDGPGVAEYDEWDAAEAESSRLALRRSAFFRNLLFALLGLVILGCVAAFGAAIWANH